MKSALRRSVPLLSIAPAFILAQHMALLLPVSFTSVVLLLLVMTIGYLKGYTLPLLLGLASAIPMLWPSVPLQAGTYKAMFYIDGEPYYGRNEEVSFEALVLSSGTDPKGYQTLTPGTRLLCRAPMLPWRNSALLQSDIQVGALISVTSIKNGPPWSRSAQLRRSGVSGYCKVKLLTKPLTTAPVSMRRALVELVWNKVGDSEALNLVLGMTIGLRGAISMQSERAFRSLSLSHLLVVSGYHFGVVFSVLLALLWFPRRLFPVQHWRFARRYFRLAALIGLVFYCELVGSELSSSRALFAAAVAYAALDSERGLSFFNSVLFAALVLCTVFPGSFFTLGMQYTFAALTGIGLALAGSDSARRRLVTVPLFATIASSAITLLWFQSFSVLGVLANILLAPIFSFLVIVPGVVALLLLAICEPLAVPLLQFSSSLAMYMRDFVWGVAALPGAAVELPGYLSAPLLCLFVIWPGRVGLLKLRAYLQWRGVFPYRSIYAMQRTFIDL